VRKLPLIAAAALILALDTSASKPPADAEQVAFAKLSGKELVEQTFKQCSPI
jgi:hypothetical protein